MSAGWKKVRPLTMRWVVTSALIVGVVVAALWYSPVGQLVDARVVHPLAFWVRDAVGQQPPIDERLKIYAFDDRTLSKTKSFVLSLPQWAQILETIAASEPRAVVIDQLFSMVPGDGADLVSSVEKIAALPLPVITGAFLTPPHAKIPYRDHLEPTLFPVPWQAGALRESSATGADDLKGLPLAEALGFNVYGPQVELRPALRRIGHLMYSGTNVISPFLQLDGEHVVPHASLLIAKSLQAVGPHIFADGIRIPVRRNGLLPINFIATADFYGQGRVKTMHQLLDVVAAGKRSTLINPGDVVLILPHMYTGHTDFAMTPYGQMPAGLLLAATLNSALTGNWIHSDAYGLVWIMVLAVAGGVLAFVLAGLSFWAAAGGVVAGVSLAGLLLFSYQSVLVDWVPAVFSFVGAALIVFAQKTRSNERAARQLRSSFEGVIPESRIAEIMRTMASVDLTAREATATIMFIDIVAFSKTTESFSSQRVFEDLRDVHQELGGLIHQYGGMVDRSLGDGVLVYFGVDITDRNQTMRTEDHAVNAVRCAVAIQQQNLIRCKERAEMQRAVYPLRIGINTGKAFFGDIGTTHRVDFTAIGMNVNFAKRLESACVAHGVCISDSTYHLVGSAPDLGPSQFERIEVAMKHATETVFAYLLRV